MERWDAVEFCAKSMGGWGWWIFAGAEGGRLRGLAHGDALGRRKGSGGEILGFGPWSLVLLVSNKTPLRDGQHW